MRNFVFPAVALSASLILVGSALAQQLPRQAPTRQVPEGLVVAPPTIPRGNLPQLNASQRTTAARELSGSNTLTAGVTRRYGGDSPVPNGAHVKLYFPVLAYVDGTAVLKSGEGMVAIRVVETSGLVMFDCPVYSGPGLTWRTRVGNTSMFNEGTAPALNSRSVFIVDVTGLQDRDIQIFGMPRGGGFAFHYCDVTALSG